MASKAVLATSSKIINVSLSSSSSSTELSLGDDKILEQISSTHAPSSSKLDVKSLLNIVTNILNRASHVVDGAVTGTQAHLEKVEDKPYQADLEVPSSLIEKLSCEMMCSCKASGQVHLHESTLSVFNKLSGYSWDAKVVLALSAYAINYGDFWLLDQIYPENKLAKPMAILKSLPVLAKPTGPLKNRIVAIHTLTKTILEVTECIVEIEKLSVKHNPKDVPTLSKAMADLPMAVYLTIKTVIACASQIGSLTTTTDESQPLLLSTLAPKLNMILGKLKDFLTICKISIEENKRYQRILKLLVTRTDNVEVLQALIYTKDDTLIDLSTKRTVKIDYLRKKHVMLFISGLDISVDELNILKKTYTDSKVLQSKGSFHLSLPIIGSSHHHEEHLFEIVWVPVVEQWTEEAVKQFEKLKGEMPWYTLHNLSVTDGAVLKFLKQVWHFQGKPIATVLNPHGKVESENAMHMIKVWGSKAFPFTETRRKELWKEQQGFNVNLVFEGVHPEVPNWIKQDKFVLFYGGTDTEWIKKLEEKVRAFSKEMGITIELVNMHGKTSKDIGLMDRFWNRVESLLFSKMDDDKDEVDEVSHEIQKLFGYKKEGKWAMLSKGPKVVISGDGNSVLDVFSHNTTNFKDKGNTTLDMIIIDLHNKVTALDPGCCHYRFPSTAGKVPETLKCPKCPRVMERYVTFTCCHKEEGTMNGHC